MKNLQKRKRLIRKLFKEVAKETVGVKQNIPIKFRIEFKGNSSSCGFSTSKQGLEYITIKIDLEGLLYQVKNGYSSGYYTTRPDRLNKYIINNRHNALRFILWHEARHAWQRLNGLYSDDERGREYDADTWALAHLKTRPQDQTGKPDQPKPAETFTPKATEYIRLYKLGYSTSKIADLCKVKDPRSIRYYLTKAGISLRRRG